MLVALCLARQARLSMRLKSNQPSLTQKQANSTVAQRHVTALNQKMLSLNHMTTLRSYLAYSQDKAASRNQERSRKQVALGHRQEP